MWKRKKKCDTQECPAPLAGIDDVVPNTPRQKQLITQIRSVRIRQDRAWAEVERCVRRAQSASG
jgi:hypothetical protein